MQIHSGETHERTTMGALRSYLLSGSKGYRLYKIVYGPFKNGFLVLRGATGGASWHALQSALAGSARAR